MKKENSYSKVNPQIIQVVNLVKNGDYKKALALGKRLTVKFDSSEVLSNTIGIIYRRLGKFKQAEFWASKAISQKHDFWAAHNNLASIYHDKGETQKAISKYNWIIEQKPDYIEARSNLALAYKAIGNYESSLKEYQRAIEVKKTPIGSFHIALTLLSLGRFSLGWEKHEYRWQVDPLNKFIWPINNRELWQGEEDKKIVLWREQGIGDDIIFLSLVREASKVSKTLSVYIDPRLIPICERSMPGISFKKYTPGSFDGEVFDYHLPMGSLPRLFRNTEKDFERVIRGYLKPDCKRVELLRDELGLGGKKVIGISWKSIKSRNHLKKSLTLMDFKKIFKDLDVTLVNLQYGDVDEEIREFKNETGIDVVQCASVDNREDLDGLAALIEMCDLVVSTSNVTIHLAGAIGKEAWVLLPYVANFWWLLDRTDSIWYPSLKLYRQKKSGDWDSITLDLRKDLMEKFDT